MSPLLEHDPPRNLFTVLTNYWPSLKGDCAQVDLSGLWSYFAWGQAVLILICIFSIGIFASAKASTLLVPYPSEYRKPLSSEFHATTIDIKYCAKKTERSIWRGCDRPFNFDAPLVREAQIKAHGMARISFKLSEFPSLKNSSVGGTKIALRHSFELPRVRNKIECDEAAGNLGFATAGIRQFKNYPPKIVWRGEENIFQNQFWAVRSEKLRTKDPVILLCGISRLALHRELFVRQFHTVSRRFLCAISGEFGRTVGSNQKETLEDRSQRQDKGEEAYRIRRNPIPKVAQWAFLLIFIITVCIAYIISCLMDGRE